MTTTYEFDSANDIDAGLISIIKNTFQNKSVRIIVEEDNDILITKEQTEELDKRLEKKNPKYISSNDSLEKLENISK